MTPAKNQHTKCQKNGKHGRLEIKWHAPTTIENKQPNIIRMVDTHYNCYNVSKTERVVQAT